MIYRVDWYSHRLGRDVRVVRWGHYGRPVLVFPTAGGDAEEIERMHLVGALWPLIDQGRIKVYSCDSVAGRTWNEDHSPEHQAWIQNQFDGFVYYEMVPHIFRDCGSYQSIVTAGASMGAYNAVTTVARHPDVFHLAIGMSGYYDLERSMHGRFTHDFYFSSPMHFLPNLPEGGAQLNDLRRCFFLLVYGQGRWEHPEHSWRLADVLGSRGIPNRVDAWGYEYDHDWPSWREMLPHYLGQLTA